MDPEYQQNAAQLTPAFFSLPDDELILKSQNFVNMLEKLLLNDFDNLNHTVKYTIRDLRKYILDCYVLHKHFSSLPPQRFTNKVKEILDKIHNLSIRLIGIVIGGEPFPLPVIKKLEETIKHVIANIPNFDAQLFKSKINKTFVELPDCYKTPNDGDTIPSKTRNQLNELGILATAILNRIPDAERNLVGFVILQLLKTLSFAMLKSFDKVTPDIKNFEESIKETMISVYGTNTKYDTMFYQWIKMAKSGTIPLNFDVFHKALLQIVSQAKKTEKEFLHQEEFHKNLDNAKSDLKALVSLKNKLGNNRKSYNVTQQVEELFEIDGEIKLAFDTEFFTSLLKNSIEYKEIQSALQQWDTLLSKNETNIFQLKKWENDLIEQLTQDESAPKSKLQRLVQTLKLKITRIKLNKQIPFYLKQDFKLFKMGDKYQRLLVTLEESKGDLDKLIALDKEIDEFLVSKDFRVLSNTPEQQEKITLLQDLKQVVQQEKEFVPVWSSLMVFGANGPKKNQLIDDHVKVVSDKLDAVKGDIDKIREIENQTLNDMKDFLRSYKSNGNSNDEAFRQAAKLPIAESLKLVREVLLNEEKKRNPSMFVKNILWELAHAKEDSPFAFEFLQMTQMKLDNERKKLVMEMVGINGTIDNAFKIQTNYQPLFDLHHVQRLLYKKKNDLDNKKAKLDEMKKFMMTI